MLHRKSFHVHFTCSDFTYATFIFSVTLKENRCYGPFNTTPRGNFVVTRVEDRKSSICKDMSFSGWDDIDKVKREVCVKVIEFQLDCSQTLEYRTGTNRGNPDKVHVGHMLFANNGQTLVT